MSVIFHFIIKYTTNINQLNVQNNCLLINPFAVAGAHYEEVVITEEDQPYGVIRQ
jgi:hypothetical protein